MKLILVALLFSLFFSCTELDDCARCDIKYINLSEHRIDTTWTMYCGDVLRRVKPVSYITEIDNPEDTLVIILTNCY